MGKKRKDFWKVIKGIRKQRIRMQQRLIGYWCVVILTLFSTAFLLLSIMGIIPGGGFESAGDVVCTAKEYIIGYGRTD